MQLLTQKWKQSGCCVGVVPTMGALHAGHLSLVKRSLEMCERTIVTIFVNPTQFAPNEDLDAYPRPFEEDCRQLEALGVSHVFSPDKQEMYPPGFSTSVMPAKIGKRLEGEFRPSHFGGVATVVLKLFQATLADKAFFGEKDFQQLAVIRKMVEDFNMPVEIVSCPIVREPDGLAMSSRNVYLSPSEREIARALNHTLSWCETEIRAGEQDVHLLMASMRQNLIDAGVTRIDYAAVADPVTLEIPTSIQGPVVILLAAHVGKTRLIDNRWVAEVK